MTAPRLATEEGKPVDDYAVEAPSDPPGGGGGGAGGGDAAPADDCPIAPLGCYGEFYVFADARGEIREVSSGQLFRRGGIESLFRGDLAWLYRHYARKDDDGHTVGFKAAQAATELMRLCAALPLWDPGMPQHGRGVWVDGGAGDPAARLLVHCGDVVIVITPRAAGAAPMGRAAGEPTITIDEFAPGFREGGALYRAMPAVMRPADVVTPDLGSELVEALSLWSWAEPNAPLIVAGWVAGAGLGAAKPWNPMLLVPSREGSGKTYLAKLIAAATPLSIYWNDFTGPGIEQAITGEARPMVLDEAEQEDDRGGGPGPAAQAVRVLRRLSDESGIHAVRGSAGGEARSGRANGQAVVVGILPPDLTAQDLTRFTRCELQKLPEGASQEDATAAIARMAALAPALWGRMLAGRARYLDNLRVLRAVLARDFKCGPRQADQPAALLAGWWTLDHDDVIDDGRAKALIAACRFAVVSGAEAEEEGGPMRCWSALLSGQPDVWGGGARRTAGQMIAVALHDDEEGMAMRGHLQSIGLRLVQDREGKWSGLWVANRFDGLARLFARTPWANSKWRDALKDLEGVRPAGSQWIGGTKVRCLFVPGRHLPPPVPPAATEDMMPTQQPP